MKNKLCWLLSAWFLLFPLAAHAADGVDADASPRRPWRRGAQEIALGHDISLALPEGFAFLTRPDAAEILTEMGSLHTETVVGVATAQSLDASWYVVFRYDDTGYVKDDEPVDAEALLTTLRDGAEEDNKVRVTRGIKPFHVDGWSAEPRYDRIRHHLVWSLDLHDDESKTVNFNTRVLGRRGVVSINLVTSPETLEGDKPHAAALLDATTFDAGARYEDFDARSDKVAEFGLVGLIVGGIGVAKLAKVGLLAAGWKWILSALVAAKKLVVVGIAAVIGFVKRLFGRTSTPRREERGEE